MTLSPALTRQMTKLCAWFSQENKFSRLYRRIFNIQEIENDTALKWFAGAILLGYHIRFHDWILSRQVTLEAVERNFYACWPFFPNCADWYFLTALPHGYSQTILYMGFFAVMVASVYFMFKGRWAWVHATHLILFAARTYFMVATYNFKGNYDYYHFAFAFVFLFLPHKRFFAQLCIVMFYFLSTSAKIHPSWVFGQYFSSMKLGLPIFGKGTEMLWTNLVIFMEMIMSWFLFSSRKWLQRSVLAFFITFHVYSGTLVSYLYPTTVLPPLIILFGPWFQPYKKIPLELKAWAGWAFIATLVMLQSIPKIIPGDEKLTMEGNFYGLYMFEANHQCRLEVRREGRPVFTTGSHSARNRCDIYAYYFTLKNRLCKGENPPAYAITFDHSINGNPFLRIVDEPDFCALTYKPFGRNHWIKDAGTAKPVARALENGYY